MALWETVLREKGKYDVGDLIAQMRESFTDTISDRGLDQPGPLLALGPERSTEYR